MKNDKWFNWLIKPTLLRGMPGAPGCSLNFLTDYRKTALKILKPVLEIGFSGSTNVDLSRIGGGREAIRQVVINK